MTLKEYLIENDISCLEFAALAGIAHSTLYNYMNKRVRPTKKNAQKIEQLTNGMVSAKELRKKVFKNEVLLSVNE